MRIFLDKITAMKDPLKIFTIERNLSKKRFKKETADLTVTIKIKPWIYSRPVIMIQRTTCPYILGKFLSIQSITSLVIINTRDWKREKNQQSISMLRVSEYVFTFLTNISNATETKIWSINWKKFLEYDRSNLFSKHDKGTEA